MLDRLLREIRIRNPTLGPAVRSHRVLYGGTLKPSLYRKWPWLRQRKRASRGFTAADGRLFLTDRWERGSAG